MVLRQAVSNVSWTALGCQARHVFSLTVTRWLYSSRHHICIQSRKRGEKWCEPCLFFYTKKGKSFAETILTDFFLDSIGRTESHDHPLCPGDQESKENDCRDWLWLITIYLYRIQDGKGHCHSE